MFAMKNLRGHILISVEKNSNIAIDISNFIVWWSNQADS